MPWARLDDSFWRNRKITTLMDTKGGPDAVALHVATISFCAEQLTDGVVEKNDLRRIVPWHHHQLHRGVTLLVTQGVWEEVTPDLRWQVHDYLDYNPSREDVLIRRENDLSRQRKKRQRARFVTA